MIARQLAAVMPNCNTSIWLDPINAAMAEWDINTPARMAMFLAQVAHESDECRRLSEDLRYSAQALMRVFRSRFRDLTEASRFAYNAEQIGNRVYAGRIGNGDEASGDGFRFRGRGLIQLTGRANYRDAGDVLGLPLIEYPQMLCEPEPAARSAAWFFAIRARGNQFADEHDLDGCTVRINAAKIGMDQRRMYYTRACMALGVL